MADIGFGLRNKYGLLHDATPEEVKRWVELTESNIKRGISREDSGSIAAKNIFRDFRAGAQTSDADTIATLLESAKEKKG